MNRDRVREIIRGPIRWKVSEIDALRVPGSHGPRCLIAEGEATIRRLWRYPDDWSDIVDDALLELIEQSPAHDKPADHPSTAESATGITSARSTGNGIDQPTIAAATEAAARASADFAELSLLRSATQSALVDLGVLANDCERRRGDLRQLIERYADSLRRGGIPPERALVLVKSALHAGIGAAECEETRAEQLVVDGVAWCIHAYYAA